MMEARTVWKFSDKTDDWELVIGARMQNLVKDLWSRMEFLIKSEKEAETVEMFVPASLLIYVLGNNVRVAILSILSIKQLLMLRICCAGYVRPDEAAPL